MYMLHKQKRASAEPAIGGASTSRKAADETSTAQNHGGDGQRDDPPRGDMLSRERIHEVPDIIIDDDGRTGSITHDRLVPEPVAPPDEDEDDHPPSSSSDRLEPAAPVEEDDSRASSADNDGTTEKKKAKKRVTFGMPPPPAVAPQENKNDGKLKRFASVPSMPKAAAMATPSPAKQKMRRRKTLAPSPTFMLVQEREEKVGSAIKERGQRHAMRRQQQRARSLKKATSTLNSECERLKAELEREKSERQRDRRAAHTSATVSARARRALEAEVRHYKDAMNEMKEAVARERDMDRAVTEANNASRRIGAAWRAKKAKSLRLATNARDSLSPSASPQKKEEKAEAVHQSAASERKQQASVANAPARGWWVASFLGGMAVACGLGALAAIALRTQSAAPPDGNRSPVADESSRFYIPRVRWKLQGQDPGATRTLFW